MATTLCLNINLGFSDEKTYICQVFIRIFSVKCLVCCTADADPECIAHLLLANYVLLINQ